MSSLGQPLPMTAEQLYRQHHPSYPEKCLRAGDATLKVGMVVSVRGYSATLSEFISSPLRPDETCAICLDVLGETAVGTTNISVSRTCGHAFHRRCIQKWRFRTHDWFSKKASCPTCRTQFREGSIVFPFNEWRVIFSDGSSSVVPATDIKTPHTIPTPFNPRHRSALMQKEKNGDYDRPMPKRALNSSR